MRTFKNAIHFSIDSHSCTFKRHFQHKSVSAKKFPIRKLMKTRNHLQSQVQEFTPASTREDSSVLPLSELLLARSRRSVVQYVSLKASKTAAGLLTSVITLWTKLFLGLRNNQESKSVVRKGSVGVLWDKSLWGYHFPQTLPQPMKQWNPCLLFTQLLLLSGSMPWLQSLGKYWQLPIHSSLGMDYFNSSAPFMPKDTLLPVTW